MAIHSGGKIVSDLGIYPPFATSLNGYVTSGESQGNRTHSYLHIITLHNLVLDSCGGSVYIGRLWVFTVDY